MKNKKYVTEKEGEMVYVLIGGGSGQCILTLPKITVVGETILVEESQTTLISGSDTPTE